MTFGFSACNDDDDNLKLQDISVEFAVSEAGMDGGTPPPRPQPGADEKEAAHRPQITFERKRPVEDFVEQRFHNGPGRN